MGSWGDRVIGGCGGDARAHLPSRREQRWDVGKTPFHPITHHPSPSSLRNQPELSENTGDALPLRIEEGGALVAGHREVLPAVLLARLCPPFRGDHLLDQSDETVAAFVRDLGRRDHSSPVRQLDVDTLLLECRSNSLASRAGYRRGAASLSSRGSRDCQGPQLARFDLVHPLA